MNTPEILAVIQEILTVSEISQSDSPESLVEWDSFSQIVILNELSRISNLPIEPEELMKFYTVKDLIERFSK